MMAYADRLERFTRWYVQLWAESLGKDGKGTTPVAALGPVDQHSQLQLFIAGPRDKLFTVVTVGAAGEGPRMDAELAALAGEPDFAGKTIGDLVAAQGRATAETLAKNGCPVRTIHIERLDEASLGELLMHFMLETIIAARLLGVDPFDQPAVEEGKVLAKRYLAEAAQRHDPHHRLASASTSRARGELRPRLRSGRAERQQALDRGAAALRRAPLAVAAGRRARAARAARRQAADPRRRAGHHGAAPPHPGAQPRRTRATAWSS